MGYVYFFRSTILDQSYFEHHRISNHIVQAMWYPGSASGSLIFVLTRDNCLRYNTSIFFYNKPNEQQIITNNGWINLLELLSYNSTKVYVTKLTQHGDCNFCILGIMVLLVLL